MHSPDSAPQPPVQPPIRSPNRRSSQFRLLLQRRFGPFFATQLAGAFNDSLLKQLVVLLATYDGARHAGWSADRLADIAVALFVAPFVMFSAPAGRLADAMDHARIIRLVKLAEIAIMLGVCAGLLLRSLELLLACLFAMGCHSAFFGPVKYAFAPRVLRADELTGGNGLLESGTFVAILAGSLGAGLLLQAGAARWLLGLVLLAVAVLGYACSRAIPSAPPCGAAVEPGRGWLADCAQLLRLARGEGVGVWNSLLAISWFWFVGALVLSQLPAIGRDLLHGDSGVFAGLLGAFALGVALGSLACERLSEHQVEIGLVPLASLLLSLSLAWLGLALQACESPAGARLRTWQEFLHAPGSHGVLAAIALLGVAGGLFVVPLYSFVQWRSAAPTQSRIISANNLLNALFMIAASLLALALSRAGLGSRQLLLVCALLNALVGVWVWRAVPEFAWRFLSWVLVHSAWRLDIRGREHIPQSGPALVCPNHVSYADALVVSALSPRPMRFVMDWRLARRPALRWLFRQVRAIPIAPQREDPCCFDAAMREVDRALAAGELVCVFPEGALSRDGRLGEFRSGVRRMLDARPVPVVPVGLDGLWDTLYSRRPRRPLLHRIRLRRRVRVRIGQALPADIGLQPLRARVQELCTPAAG